MLLSFLLYLSALLATFWLQRRLPRAFAVAPVVLAVVGTPFWMAQDHAFASWFTWAKLYSVLAGLAFFNLIRIWKPLEKWRWAGHVACAILVVNILEAIALDGVQGNWLNAAAGGLLVLGLGLAYGPSRIAVTGEHRDLSWELPRLWVVAYTVWNITFVLGAFPTSILMHAAVLGSALAVGLWRPGLWVQARVITLGVHVAVAWTAPLVLEPMRAPDHSAALTLVSGVSLLVGLAAVGRAWADRRPA